MNAYISYLDLLGFSLRISQEEFSTKYQSLAESFKTVGQREEENLSMFFISDSIIIISENFEAVKFNTSSLYEWGIAHDIWVRGAITKGEIKIPAIDSIHYGKALVLPFLGEGYLRAYDLESQLNLSGVAFDRERVWEQLNENNSIIYNEYFPKTGNEKKKHLLIPGNYADSKPSDAMLESMVNGLHFEKILRHHIDDLDKYINTFCFHIKLLVKYASAASIITFLEKMREQLFLDSRRILIPSKVIVVFVALCENLIEKTRTETAFFDASQLEFNISTILANLSQSGHLTWFIDFVTKNKPALYRDLLNLKLDVTNFK